MLSYAPDALVIIDAPEFTHAVAKRVRLSASGYSDHRLCEPDGLGLATRPARAMKPYVDHLLALLPFEPASHERLGGPPCSYVGHPLVERLAWLDSLDPAPLAERLKLAPDRHVLVLLPGSRRSEVSRLLPVFRDAVSRLADLGHRPHLLLPVVSSMREEIAEATAAWQNRPHLVAGEEDKWRAFKLARAALAASGTVTLELAAAGTPMVVAYKVEPLIAPLLRRTIKGPSVVLANLVLGENACPEFLQEDCSPEQLASALAAAMSEGPARTDQLRALARTPERLAVEGNAPSRLAAAIVLDYATRGRRSA